MIFGAIAAGGSGSRMKDKCEIDIDKPLPDMPKQFLPMRGRPIIYYSIKAFLQSKIDMLIIGVGGDYHEYMQSTVQKYFAEYADKIIITLGGKDRNETVMNMIKAAREHCRCGEKNYIITHDAARPFVTVQMIEQNIEAVKKYGAVDTACAATDTVVEVENGFIAACPDRNRLCYGQTPQSFDMDLLYELYNSLSDKQKSTLTDCCQIFYLCQKPVFIAKGDKMNMKITSKNDYFLACAAAEFLL